MNNSLSRHENLIPTTQLIMLAKKAGFDFGPGDPNNRLRYYTKTGLLPHAQRKQIGNNSFTQGHYPASALDQLLKIQNLKREGKSFEEIYTAVNLPAGRQTNLSINSRNLTCLPAGRSFSLSLRRFTGIFLLIFTSALITLLIYHPINTSLTVSDLTTGTVAAAEISPAGGPANFCRQ